MAYMDSDWEPSDYISRFGKSASFYPPKITDIDRHPDKRPSSSRLELESRGRELKWALEVRGLGAMIFITDSEPASGRLTLTSGACYSDEVLQFGLEAEPGAPR